MLSRYLRIRGHHLRWHEAHHVHTIAHHNTSTRRYLDLSTPFFRILWFFTTRFFPWFQSTFPFCCLSTNSLLFLLNTPSAATHNNGIAFLQFLHSTWNFALYGTTKTWNRENMEEVLPLSLLLVLYISCLLMLHFPFMTTIFALGGW